MSPTPPTFLLVHGSWHDGTCWTPVRKHLAAAGVRSIAPTLPGHTTGDDLAAVTHDDYVSAVLTAFDALTGPVILVGHSFGGSVIYRVAHQRPARCAALVYYSAFVPRDGERVADSLPPEFLTFLQATAAERADRAIVLPPAVFRSAFANTVDAATADALYAQMVPEPSAPIYQPLALSAFPTLDLPTSYVTLHQDQSLPAGTFHPGQSARLPDAQLIELDGDHEALLTAPHRLAWALLTAVDTALIRPKTPATLPSATSRPASSPDYADH